jgi:hypothetical protein
MWDNDLMGLIPVILTPERCPFSPRTVRDWNMQPPDIVELDTPEAFKARIVSL